MQRNPDWVEAMQQELDRHSALAFSYGGADCLSMCADVILAMTGEDPFKHLRTYRSLNGALRKLKAEGHEAFGDLVASILPEVPPLVARRGDLAFIDDDRFLGVVTGAVVLAKGNDDMVAVPLRSAKRAFRVG